MRAGAQRPSCCKPIQSDKLLATVDGAARAAAGPPHGQGAGGRRRPADRAICGEVLLNLGFEVGRGRLARRGAALDARRSRPDMLLLDVALPDGDGFELLRGAQGRARLRAALGDLHLRPHRHLGQGARAEAGRRRLPDQALRRAGAGRAGGVGAAAPRRRRAPRRPPRSCPARRRSSARCSGGCGAHAAVRLLLPRSRQPQGLQRLLRLREGRRRGAADRRPAARDLRAGTAAPGDFLGHVAGDDFVFITRPRAASTRVCQRAVETFDRIIPLYYDRRRSRARLHRGRGPLRRAAQVPAS